MVKRNRPERLNYMMVAVDILGGPGAAADAIGVTRAAIYKWMKAAEEGRMGDLSYKYIIAISQASGLPPSVLTGIPNPKRAN